MTPPPPRAARLRRLAHDLRNDAEALSRLQPAIDDLLVRLQSEPGGPALGALALLLHHVYTAHESAFVRTAKVLEEQLPSGASWHSELLRDMSSEVPGVRPAVVDATSVSALAALLRFRHFIRNAYFVDLDPEKVRARAADALATLPSSMAKLSAFADFIDTAASALESDDG